MSHYSTLILPLVNYRVDAANLENLQSWYFGDCKPSCDCSLPIQWLWYWFL